MSEALAAAIRGRHAGKNLASLAASRASAFAKATADEAAGRSDTAAVRPNARCSARSGASSSVQPVRLVRFGTPWYAFARLMTPSNAFLRFATGQTGEEGDPHLPLRLRGSTALRSFICLRGRAWIGPACAGLNFRAMETGPAKMIHHRGTKGTEKAIARKTVSFGVKTAANHSTTECYENTNAPTLPPLPCTSAALWRNAGATLACTRGEMAVVLGISPRDGCLRGNEAFTSIG